MIERKQIMVSLSKEDLEKYEKVVQYLKINRIQTKDSEVLKITLRYYYDQIKKELGAALEEHSPKS